MTSRAHRKSQGLPAQSARPLWSRLGDPAFLVGLLILAVTAAVYWQITRFRFVNYDDYEYVVKNPRVHAGLTADNIRWMFTETYFANWHPLTWISYMLDAEIFGIDPWGYHLTNLILHAANALLLFHVVRALTGSLWKSGLVAAIFAVHPLHVETVAWVSDRKDLLCTLFGLAAIGAYCRFAQGPGALVRCVAGTVSGQSVRQADVGDLSRSAVVAGCLAVETSLPAGRRIRSGRCRTPTCRIMAKAALLKRFPTR